MGLLSSLISGIKDIFDGGDKKKKSSSKKKTSSSSTKKSVSAASTYTPKTTTVSTPSKSVSAASTYTPPKVSKYTPPATTTVSTPKVNTYTPPVTTTNKNLSTFNTNAGNSNLLQYNKNTGKAELVNPFTGASTSASTNFSGATNPNTGVLTYTPSTSNNKVSSSSSNKSNNASSIPNGAFSYLAPSTDSLMEQAAAELNAASGASGYSSSGGSGGVSVPNTQPIGIDLSDILAAYTASAEAQKKAVSDSVAAQKKMLEDNLAAQLKTLETSEASQRDALLTSLKRFQEDTAKARSQQQASFNANRADLEAQAFMANRAAMQSAASRGLGGSGLQQLAQLQNLINQSGEVNELATGNTEALNTLAQNLARQEQDTTTNINNIVKEMQNKKEALTTEQKNTLSALLSEEVNNLNKIETNTTSLKEELKYQEAVRAENARVQAEQFAANLQAQNASIAANQAMYNRQLQAENKAIADSTISGLAAAVTDYSNLIKSASKSSTKKNKAEALKENNSKVQAQYDAAISALASIYAGSGLSQSYLDTYRKQLDSVYSQYYRG